MISGRVAIITGSSHGIGRGIAERLASAGATVVLSSRNTMARGGERGGLELTAETIRSRGGVALTVPADVTDHASRQDLVRTVMSELGRIDVLVNNAGSPVYARTQRMSMGTASGQVAQYLLGPWDLCHQVIPHMLAQGAGWIVNLGSVSVVPPQGPPYTDDASLRSRSGETLYAALKAAVHRLSVGMAAELYSSNIAVNVVAPVGAVMTPGLLSVGLVQKTPPDVLATYLEPVEHIAEAVLASVSAAPTAFTGNIVFSHQYLDSIGRSTMTLDGTETFEARDGARTSGRRQ